MASPDVLTRVNADLDQLARGRFVNRIDELETYVSDRRLEHTSNGVVWREPPDLLDFSRLSNRFTDFTVDHFHLIGSTNDHLMGLGVEAVNRIAVAEGQVAGRGRRHRAWVSPYARSLSISFAVGTQRNLLELGGLSTVVGISLCRVLRGLGGETVGVKWPNDLLVDGQKICGILTELNRVRGLAVVIVGVGVNVALTDEEIAAVSQPVTDLARLGIDMDRTSLTEALLAAMLDDLTKFESNGLVPFIAEFDAMHLLQGEQCTVHLGETVESGRVVGLDVDGALKLETRTGVKAYHGGEVSLRRASEQR